MTEQLKSKLQAVKKKPQSARFRLLDGVYIAMMIVPFVIGMLVKVLTEPASEGIQVTGALIYTTVLAMAIDRVHIQNINTSVMIFTKKTGISKAIMEQTGRGVTNWDGEGAYTNKTSYILFVMISKYEVNQIRQIVHSIDPNAFMIFTEGCSVDGNFEKRL